MSDFRKADISPTLKIHVCNVIIYILDTHFKSISIICKRYQLEMVMFTYGTARVIYIIFSIKHWKLHSNTWIWKIISTKETNILKCTLKIRKTKIIPIIKPCFLLLSSHSVTSNNYSKKKKNVKDYLDIKISHKLILSPKILETDNWNAKSSCRVLKTFLNIYF